jgi:hypothetical protein
MIRMPTSRTVARHAWGTDRELRLRAPADAPDACGRTRADDPAHQAGDGQSVDHTGSRWTPTSVTARSGVYGDRPKCITTVEPEACEVVEWYG